MDHDAGGEPARGQMPFDFFGLEIDDADGVNTGLGDVERVAIDGKTGGKNSAKIFQTGNAEERQYASWCARARGAGCGSA